MSNRAFYSLINDGRLTGNVIGAVLATEPLAVTGATLTCTRDVPRSYERNQCSRRLCSHTAKRDWHWFGLSIYDRHNHYIKQYHHQGEQRY